MITNIGVIEDNDINKLELLCRHFHWLKRWREHSYSCTMSYKYVANFICLRKLMSHTFTNLHFHFVFRTKDSLELITDEIKPELYAYLGGLTKELKGKPLAINGMSEHIHLLVSLPPTVSISDALKFLKANSSKWMNERFGKEFAWQIGYGAFSVSRSQVDAVVKYIQNQEEHHQKYDSKEEFLKLLRNHEVEFDENYLWK